MELGAIFAPTVDTPAHIELAERLGYRYAFVYDSPTFLADPWMVLAQAARTTSQVVLGVSVLTPRMRHLAATAGAVATLRAMAPGRVAMVLGTGFTSQLMVGKRPAPWAEVEAYLVALRRLLAGEEIEWDRAVIGLCHGRLTGMAEGGEVPLWMAAHGPKGYAVAARVADGVVTHLTHGARNALGEQAEHAFVLFYGTVLDPGEDLDSERVVEAAGPTAAFQLHLGGEGIAGGTPEWREYEAAVADIDERRRHLEVHGGHLIEVSELERPLITPELIATTTESGTPEHVRERVGALAASGVRGALFGPQGGDVARELRAFVAAVGLTGPVS
ncbi:MAG: LLM class flavin-dependent oxidoreductase [Acidimicrobiales bacterium]